MRQLKIFNQRGLGLIEVVIASAVLLTVILSGLTVVDSMIRENTRFRIKAELIDVRNGLANSFNSPGVCAYNVGPLNAMTIDTTQIGVNPGYYVSLNEIRDGAAATPLPSTIAKVGEKLPDITGTIMVDSIRFMQFQQINTDEFTANLYVNIRSSNPSMGVLAPLKVLKIRFVTNAASPANAKTVADCGAGGAALGSNCRLAEYINMTDYGIAQIYCNADEELRHGGGNCERNDGTDWDATTTINNYGYVTLNQPIVHPVTGQLGWEFDCWEGSFGGTPRSHVVAICCRK